jgi:hypothetical protein
MGLRQFRAGGSVWKSPIYSDLMLQIYLSTKRGGGANGAATILGQLGSGKPLGATAGLRLVPGQVFFCVWKSPIYSDLTY